MNLISTEPDSNFISCKSAFISSESNKNDEIIYKFTLNAIKKYKIIIPTSIRNRGLPSLHNRLIKESIISFEMKLLMLDFFKICCIEIFEYGDIHLNKVVIKMEEKLKKSLNEDIKNTSHELAFFWAAGLWTTQEQIKKDLKLDVLTNKIIDNNNCIHKCRALPPGLEYIKIPTLDDYINAFNKINCKLYNSYEIYFPWLMM